MWGGTNQIKGLLRAVADEGLGDRGDSGGGRHDYQCGRTDRRKSGESEEKVSKKEGTR